MATRRGRLGKDVANLFSGLIRDARDGSPYIVAYRPRQYAFNYHGNNWPILRNKSSIEGEAHAVTFCLSTFEWGMLHHLQQNPPHNTLEQLVGTYMATECGIFKSLGTYMPAEYNVIIKPNKSGQNRKALARAFAARTAASHRQHLSPGCAAGRILRIATVQVCPFGKQWSHFEIVHLAAKSGRKSNKRIGRRERSAHILNAEDEPIISNHLDLRNRENVAHQERVIREIDTKELFSRFVEEP